MVEVRVWSGVRTGVLADEIVSYLLTGLRRRLLWNKTVFVEAIWDYRKR